MTVIGYCLSEVCNGSVAQVWEVRCKGVDDFGGSACNPGEFVFVGGRERYKQGETVQQQIKTAC